MPPSRCRKPEIQNRKCHSNFMRIPGEESSPPRPVRGGPFVPACPEPSPTSLFEDGRTMHICRYTLPDRSEPRVGLLGPDGVRDVTAATRDIPAMHWPVPPGDAFIAHLPMLRAKIERLASDATPIPRDAVRLLSPVANPGKIICGVGNWKHMGAPLGMLGFLFKASSAVAGPDEGVQIRWPHRTTLHEPELAIVIGKTCTNVSAAEALDHVAGYTAALDMTMKGEKEFHCFCKSFDTYGILGPALVTADAVADPSILSYRFKVNGEIRGERSFRDLTGSPAELVAFASSAMTLYPGDVILSGAADVDEVVPGDVMTLEIDGLGHMNVPVRISH
ncbi:fumarylacetoacetate hydrolase family protein [Novosphingobium resinovorum]|uniref:fumarylacetoacetate hydrolase family protein n=1 Tax=Novosphingobium resinovorum TaxID=158500 RepID=UPI002ED148F5|nr:fumarylacetoacetate hydrolase family protein [Novosphingobium resinovorum]